jgi:hypothetical protein
MEGMAMRKKRKVSKAAQKRWSERYRNMANFAPAHPIERDAEPLEREPADKDKSDQGETTRLKAASE